MPVQLYAAALETSNQSIASFLEPNDYAEVSTAIINAHIAGKTYRPDANNPSEFSEVSTPNFVKRFVLSNVALKLQVQPEWSLGLIYDQPYTTDISYAFKPVLSSSAQLVNAVNFKTDSDNLTALLGYQPNLSWNYYGGVSYQNLDTQLQISGQSMGLLMDYSANAENDSAMGWLAGISYQIPAYALKTSLTYRSKIRHHPLLQEQIFSTPTILALNLSAARHINIETPQSVNFDFQSGINPNNLIYTSLRWVNWEKFKILSPLLSTTEPVSLVDYKKNQFSGTLGIAHIFNDQWTSTIDMGWDSGIGNAASTLSPADGSYSIGLGSFYHLNKNIFIAGGIKYFRLNKAKVNQDQQGSGNLFGVLSSVGNNNVLAYGIKLGYRF